MTDGRRDTLARLAGRLFLAGSTVGVVGFYARALWQLEAVDPKRVETVERAARSLPLPEGTSLPRVSIILPARNEERNIRRSVESLLAQDYPAFEVIVVDDDSTDATSTILRDIQQHNPHRDRLRVVRSETLPAGWAGKPHAIHTGVQHATGDWLLFTDADTCHNPSVLQLAVRAALAQNLDLLSLETTQELPDFWGRVLMPLAYLGISMQYDARAVNDPNSHIAIANGQFILLRRSMYDRIGGYASPSLRSTLVDDRDLAVAVKRAHGHMALLPGPDLVHTRMYTSLREHVDGWGKNAVVGSRGGPLFFAAMLAGLPIVGILPFAELAAGLVSRRKALLAAGAVQVAALLYYRVRLDERIGVPARYALTQPLASAVFLAILGRSWLASLRHTSVAWRGRRYQLPRSSSR